jgi:hypothetical protein
MVTLPSEAASDADLVASLVTGQLEWTAPESTRRTTTRPRGTRMASHVRAASETAAAEP